MLDFLEHNQLQNFCHCLLNIRYIRNWSKSCLVVERNLQTYLRLLIETFFFSFLAFASFWRRNATSTKVSALNDPHSTAVVRDISRYHCISEITGWWSSGLKEGLTLVNCNTKCTMSIQQTWPRPWFCHLTARVPQYFNEPDLIDRHWRLLQLLRGVLN